MFSLIIDDVCNGPKFMKNLLFTDVHVSPLNQGLHDAKRCLFKYFI